MVFRDLEDILDEVRQLYAAGVRNVRLGQQTCFFSTWNRDVAQIERLLAGIRAVCPALDVLHIDNADPLAVASPAGARIAGLILEHCSEGNCAPMGMESFDPAVIEANALTCTPQIPRRAIDNINDVGNQRGPAGLPALLPGINIIYGLPGETHRTHLANLQGLDELMTAGVLCHRTNVASLTAEQADPADLLAHVRQHWSIGVLYWVGSRLPCHSGRCPLQWCGKRLSVDDVQTGDGAGEGDVQALQAARSGLDDAGRFGDHDGVELQALGKGGRDAHQPGGLQRVGGGAEQRGLESFGQ